MISRFEFQKISSEPRNMEIRDIAAQPEKPKILFYKNNTIYERETHILDSFEKLKFDKAMVSEIGDDNTFILHLYEITNRFAKVPPFRTVSKYAQNFLVKIALYLELLEHKPDIVLAQFGHSGNKIQWSAQKYGCPLVTYFRGYDASRNYERIRKEGIYKSLFGYCSATISTSSYIRDNIIELGANPDTAFVLPSGANTNLLSEIRKNKIQKHGKRFISVGRFVDKKAHHNTILAFSNVLKYHPDAELVIIGKYITGLEDPEYWAYCNTLVKNLKIEYAVKFLGQLSHRDVLVNLLESDIYVQHSIKSENGNSEGTPVSIMEASAAGLPIVSTRHSGIPDVVNHGKTGFLVGENDIDGMAHFMLELLNDPKLRLNMGINGRMRIEKHFSHDVIIPRLEHILQWVHSPFYADKPELLPDWS